MNSRKKMDLIRQDELLDYKWTERQGYSDEEIAMFEELLHSNAHLLYRYAENGGLGEERWTKIALIEKTQIQFPKKLLLDLIMTEWMIQSWTR